MHSDPIVVPARRLAGLAVRTSFARVSIDAGALWQRAIADGIVGAGPVVAAYTDYVGDHRGDYTMWVAAELAAGARCPPARAELTVAAGRYVRFAADGDPAHAVARAWHHVWTEWPDRDRRSYRTDLELHGVRGPGTADLYVGIL